METGLGFDTMVATYVVHHLNSLSITRNSSSVTMNEKGRKNTVRDVFIEQHDKHFLTSKSNKKNWNDIKIGDYVFGNKWNSMFSMKSIKI